ncbi:DUF4157 domain-containing protein [Actinokineospora cianjurensis]|uniref:Uncharacterized protein DUF4157 n=1 Tax=Actinokineospora cianjurensis TaxID=585224 RepID=A0A421BC79_9PSEU|nr:DUF4157 domain-containing protein [Actinokineospora cianjurensis]RLK61969.1 uncharacterized protein DUF4157 [Actinokineospora cianjurensis]
MHEHEQVDKAGRRSAPRRSPEQAESTTRIQQLQRSLGNAAVARLLSSEVETTEPTGVHDVLGKSGQPLADRVRTDMEARLGADFSSVRVHDDSAAARSADEIGAHAYTSGEHVVLGRGGGDDHTLAHELWHVVQQREGPVSATDHGNGVALSDPGDRFERAAEDVATRAMSGPAPEHTGHADHAGHAHPGAVQRSPRDWRNSDHVRSALTAEPGGLGLRRSFWPAVTQAVRAYISVHDNTQLDQRRDILNTLEEAITAWEDNQRGTVTLNTGGARDKRAIIAELVGLIATERAEIRAASAPQQPAASAARPMAMPGLSSGGTRPMAIGGASRGRPGQDGDDSSPEGRIDMAGLRDRFASVANLPPGIDIHAHLTRGRNLPGIHDQGLMPGASRGIGLPDTDREPDTAYTYLLSGSPPAAGFVSQEAGGRAVGVVSSNVAFGPDTNYPGGSYMHHGGIPPVRDNTQGGNGPFSFTLPATPRTRQGLRDFVNAHLPNGQQQLTEAEALERVLAALWRTFGIRAAGDLSRG